MGLNDREIAFFVWALLFFVFILWKRDFRSGFFSVIRALLQRKLVAVLLATEVWVVGSVWVLYEVGLWEVANLKTTLFWNFGFLTGTVFKVNSFKLEKGYLWGVLKNILSFTVVMSFLVSSYDFGVLLELVVFPVIIFLVLVQIFSEKIQNSKPVRDAASWMLGGYFCLCLFWSLYKAYGDFMRFSEYENLLEFWVPILLSLMSLPFACLLCAYVSYESGFVSLAYGLPNAGDLRYAKIMAVLRFRFRLDLFDRWLREVRVVRPEGKIEIGWSIDRIKYLAKCERNPPEVGAFDGWSPYIAKSFLNEYGLVTDDYHRSYEGAWIASTNLLEIGGGFPSSNIAYYVEGEERVAKVLKLKLNVNGAVEPVVTEKFLNSCYELLERSIDDWRECAELLSELQDFESQVGGVRVSLETEMYTGTMSGYSLRFTVSRGWFV